MNKILTTCQKLNKIDAINQGGCGISALALAIVIRKVHKIKKVKFIFMHQSDTVAYSNNKQYLKNGEGEPKVAMHILVLYRNKAYDSNGEYILNYLDKYTLEVNEQFLRKSIVKGIWNRYFERETQIPLIEKMLNIKLRVK